MSSEKQDGNSRCCYKLSAIIKAKSPLHIGNGKRTGIIKHSLPFIPGSIIRGTIGKCLQRVSEDDNHELHSLLFAEEAGKSSKIFFRHCYPLHFKCNTNERKNAVFVPASKTLFKCQNKQCGKLYNTYEPPLQCVNCGKSVKPFFGFRCTNCEELESYPVMLDRFSSSAIDRSTYSAMIIPVEPKSNYMHIINDLSEQNIVTGEKHGLLHTIEAIEKDTEFVAEVILSSSCYLILDKISSLLTRVLEDEGIGGLTSRGYGDTSVKDVKIKEITNDIIESRAQEIIYKSQDNNNNNSDENNINVKSNNPVSFSAYLISPMVIDNTQRSLESSILLEGSRRAYSWCFKEGKPSLPEIRRTRQIFSYDLFGGWSMKENRSRRNAISMSSGSSFHFECNGNNTKLGYEDLGKALASLEYYAIGGYKPHGYGQISITSLYKG